MSRTIRRKGKEPRWLLDDPEWIMRIWGRTLKKQKAMYHSDAWRDHNCGKWGQRVWHKKIRQYDRQEMHRFLVEEEYEPLWFTTKIDTWWWD